MRFKLEIDAGLAAELAQKAALAEEKAQKVQSENGRLQETLADKERASLALKERIERLENNLRNT